LLLQRLEVRAPSREITETYEEAFRLAISIKLKEPATLTVRLRPCAWQFDGLPPGHCEATVLDFKR
jgi:hypothetical protein